MQLVKPVNGLIPFDVWVKEYNKLYAFNECFAKLENHQNSVLVEVYPSCFDYLVEKELERIKKKFLEFDNVQPLYKKL